MYKTDYMDLKDYAKRKSLSQKFISCIIHLDICIMFSKIQGYKKDGIGCQEFIEGEYEYKQITERGGMGLVCILVFTVVIVY